MFEIFIPIAMCDPLSDILTPYLKELFNEPDIDEFKKTRSFDQMADIGYDSYNPVVNMGMISVLIVLYLVKILVFVGVYLFFKKTGRSKSIYLCLKHQVFFSSILILLLEGYMELLIAGGLIYDAPSDVFDKSWYYLYLSSLLIGLATIFIPSVIIWFMVKKKLSDL